MTESVFKIVELLLGIVGGELKTKYEDDVRKYKRDYYAEKAKPRPDMAVMDNLKRELRLVVDAIDTAIRRQNAGN